MLNEFKTLNEMIKKIPNIIEEIEKLSEKYEADTFVTGITFLHMLFDAFVDYQNFDREETYIWFADSGIKHARKLKEQLDILSEKRS